MATDRLNRKALLRERGFTLTALADEYGVTKSHLSRVVAGQRRSIRLETELARKLRMPRRAAFPEWYAERVA